MAGASAAKVWLQANGATASLVVLSEEITVAASATTDSTQNLLPANSLIVAVSVRTNAAMTTAVNYDVGDAAVSATRFHTDVLDTVATTAVWTGASAQAAAAKIRLTPNATPGAADGKVRVVVFALVFGAPTA